VLNCRLRIDPISGAMFYPRNGVYFKVREHMYSLILSMEAV
jgi:hypothetical protein